MAKALLLRPHQNFKLGWSVSSFGNASEGPQQVPEKKGRRCEDFPQMHTGSGKAV